MRGEKMASGHLLVQDPEANYRAEGEPSAEYIGTLGERMLKRMACVHLIYL